MVASRMRVSCPMIEAELYACLGFSRFVGYSGTAAGYADFFDYGPDKRSHRRQFDALTMHILQQRLTLRVYEIQFSQIQNGSTIPSSRLSRLPALPEFFNPRTRQSALQLEAKFAGAVMQSDLQHPQFLSHAHCRTQKARDHKHIAMDGVVQPTASAQITASGSLWGVICRRIRARAWR